MQVMSMWENIRRKRKKRIIQIVKDTGVSRQIIYLFEKGKCQNIKLMSYYLKLSGRQEDLILANILDEDYEEYYKNLKCDKSRTISEKEFNELVEGANKKELHELITAGVNETIPMSNKQLLKLVKLKNEVIK